MIFAPDIEISLRWMCGCSWSTTVHRVPEGEVLSQQAAEPCIPATCPTCIEYGRPCAMRAGMPPAYSSIDWTEVVPSKRAHYKRMKRK